MAEGVSKRKELEDRHQKERQELVVQIQGLLPDRRCLKRAEQDTEGPYTNVDTVVHLLISTKRPV